MAKLHHATLKAALAAYAILLAEGKNETEIREAISKDEKEFSPEEIEEIYQAIINPPAPPAPSPKKEKFVVLKPFRDIADFSKEIEIGKDVSDFNSDRLAHLVEIGYVEKQ
jgi:hypothetical protein